MGYQEFTYKINNIDLFYEKLDEIKDLMQKQYYRYEHNGKIYEGYNNKMVLINFKRNVGDIKRGYHLYIVGERASGKDIILELNTILGQRQRFNFIENMIWSEKHSEILRNIFKKVETEYAKLILDLVTGEEIKLNEDISW